MKNILNSSDFDEFCKIINYFENLFDQKEAIENHFIIPKDEEVEEEEDEEDEIIIEFKNSKKHEILINEEFEKYLTKIKTELKYASIKYTDRKSISSSYSSSTTLNDTISIEISNKFKEIPSNFQLISSLKTKG